MKTIIERMCSISEKMRDDNGKMSLQKMDKASADIRALSHQMGLSAKQVVILTAIIQKSSRYRIESEDIATELGLEYLKFLTYHKEMESLQKKGYIRMDKDGDVIIPKEVISSLKENNPVKPDPIEGLDSAAILSRIRKILSIREDDQITTMEASNEIGVIMELNPDTGIAKAAQEHLTCVHFLERIAYYGLIYRYYYQDDDRVSWHDLDDYFTDDDMDWLRGRYMSEKLGLQRKGIITYSSDEGLVTKDFFKLTDDAKDKIFSDLGGVKKKTAPVVSASRKIAASEITPKKMFYNKNEGSQVARLKELICPERFDSIRDKMKEKGLRTAFTCLFYGGPGTGKTETVYQIARESGRDLFIVDVSQIKSCWVGESEKNIKDVFNKYRSCVKSGGTVPILLFNEADAIFGIRQSGAERAVDKMENSIQNIILQEMEDLDGILIATTNLTANLDKAFERRFLYKVRFNKPSLEAKVSIWKAMMGELSDKEAIQLANDYDFSGGQIENVSRKKTIRSIIDCAEPSFMEIKKFCDEENMGERPVRKPIGF